MATSERKAGPASATSRRGKRWGLAALAVIALGGTAGAAWMAIGAQQKTAGRPMEKGALSPAPIQGERAYSYLKGLCTIGPRPAGSEANTRQRNLVAEHFRLHGGKVTEQPFTARHPLSGEPVAMANLVGSWFPERMDRVVLAAHYDTRPFPDRDPDPARRRDPFVGANDGASGVALLMEIAHHLAASPTKYGVDLVLLDGEELVFDRQGDYFLGSKEFARQYRAGRRSGKVRYKYSAGMVLDMVADVDLTLPQEPYSVRLAPRLVRDVWDVARRLNATAFKSYQGTEVLDDHLAMNDGGIPTIDIIDFDYPQWHTASDTPEHCSAASLEQVGRVVTAWLNKPKARR